ncbi:MAG: hypothetical protein WAW06_09200 [bacterium]
MQVKRSNILRHFRGRRAVIPVVAAAVAVFVAVGGHKGIVSFAMDEMTGFLVGTGDAGSSPALEGVKATAPSGAAGSRDAAALREGPRIELAQAEPKPRAAESKPASATKAAPAAAGTAAEPVQSTPQPAPRVATAPAGDSVAVRPTESVYTASFLRDPFYSLVQAGKDVPSKLLDVGVAKMVGSVWGESGIIALLEDDTGRSYALKKGDRVLNGRVISVTPASVTFSITVFGLTKTVTLELAEEGE